MIAHFLQKNDSNLSMRIDQAKHYLEEYEKEVARAQGANRNFQSKEDALGRIKVLCEFAPNDPRVQNLFDRAKACVKTGAGAVSEIDPNMTVYLVNEEKMRKHFAEVSKQAWDQILIDNAANKLERMFPTPDYKEYNIDI